MTYPTGGVQEFEYEQNQYGLEQPDLASATTLARALSPKIEISDSYPSRTWSSTQTGRFTAGYISSASRTATLSIGPGVRNGYVCTDEQTNRDSECVKYTVRDVTTGLTVLSGSSGSSNHTFSVVSGRSYDVTVRLLPSTSTTQCATTSCGLLVPFDVTWQELLPAYTYETRTGSGLRVKRVLLRDSPDDLEPEVRTFRYSGALSPAQSSGDIVAEPRSWFRAIFIQTNEGGDNVVRMDPLSDLLFGQLKFGGGCHMIIQQSEPAPLPGLSAAQRVWYGRVVEERGTLSDPVAFGSTNYTFETPEYDRALNLSYGVRSSSSNQPLMFPEALRVVRGWLYGTPRASAARNSAGTELRTRRMTYDYEGEAHLQQRIAGFERLFFTPPSGTSFVSDYWYEAASSSVLPVLVEETRKE